MVNAKNIRVSLTLTTINTWETLGTGNHFIEICLDESDQVWIMLHSGSRGIGNAIGTYFIDLAQKEMQDQLETLPSRDLAYFMEGTEYFDDYLRAVAWAQLFASLNRDAMMENVVTALQSITQKTVRQPQTLAMERDQLSPQLCAKRTALW